MGKFRDLTGQVFGRLTVLKLSGRKGRYGMLYWECACECGNTKTISMGSFTSGNSRSCGCLQKDLARKLISGSGNYFWKGGRRKYNGYISILSPDHPRRGSDNHVFEHRLVVEKHLGRYLTEDEVVHHENGIKTDNRLENLKLFASQGEHMAHHHAIGTPLFVQLK